MKNSIYQPSLFFISCICASMFFLTSCTSDNLINQNTVIPDGLWDKRQIMSYVVDVPDTSSRYNLYINVRSNTDYAYSNLYLFMNTIYPDKQVSRDTIDCMLAASDGKWFGSGYGKYRFLSLMLGNSFSFPQKGTYTFELEQAMRHDTLKNINDIGIKIEKISLTDSK